MAKKQPKGRKPQKPAAKASTQPKAAPKPLIPEKYQPYAQHIGILLGFLALLFAYFNPLLQGQVIQMSDIQSFAGMTEEVRNYREATGEEAFWSNSIFSGMPTFHMGLQYTGNLINMVRKAYFELLPNPVSFIFLLFAGFYLLMHTLGMRPWVSAIGGVAFSFSSYFFIILAAGHTSKAAAIGFMAPVIAGVLMAYKGKPLRGALLTAVALALELDSNHFQITYYLAFVLLFIALAYLVEAIREKTLPAFAKASGMLLLAAALGTAPSAGLLLTTAEYASETTRGQSELTPPDGSPKSSGLDKEYALRWSYGQAETFTLLIPNFYGGASNAKVSQESEAARAFRTDRLPTYWGDQPSTSGPVYIGAIICFLFVLGLWIVPGPTKWWLLAATLFSVTLSWGRNMEWLTDIFFYNIPMYNKFRAVSMMLVVAELTMPLLGILALDKVLRFKSLEGDAKDLGKKILIAGGITGGLALFFLALGPTLFSFSGGIDERLQPEAVNLLVNLRKDMFQADALRAVLLVAISTGALWFFVQDRLKAGTALAVIGILTLGDMWTVNKRYLGNDEFERKENYSTPAAPPASQVIMQDDDPHFRVINFYGGNIMNTFNSSQDGFFHKNVGGYHPAKLQRYQDLIDRHIIPEMTGFLRTLQQQQQDTNFQATLQNSLRNLDVLNMLNTKYLIISGDQRPLPNPNALGNAWFVNELRWVENADEEIEALGQIKPGNTAVVDIRFKEQLGDFTPRADAAATIALTEYSPNTLAYSSNASTDQFAVFSEVYYNSGKGWKAYIDDEEVPHVRCDYVLRGLKVPAGQHTIRFEMEPSTYIWGETLSLISSIILILASILMIAWPAIQRRREA